LAPTEPDHIAEFADRVDDGLGSANRVFVHRSVFRSTGNAEFHGSKQMLTPAFAAHAGPTIHGDFSSFVIQRLGRFPIAHRR